jgi:hypothetical protein
MRLAVALVRMWTACYTWGLPRDARAARRQEIDSDLWECLDGDDPISSATSLVGRLVLGIPDDLAWRHEQPRRTHVGLLVLAITVAVLSGVMWMMGRTSVLPVPEPLPRFSRFDRTDPPPPPPPPPCPPPGSADTAPSPCAPFR